MQPNENEIQALISLLDDTDEEVLIHVTDKLLALGHEVLPLLEDRYLAEPASPLQTRIQGLIDRIHHTDLHEGLGGWAKAGGKDLFEGAYWLAKSRYPELDRQRLDIGMDRLKLDAWLELNFQLAPADKVRVLNYVFFDLHKFKGNTDDYHSPVNSYINRVLETHKGNPITLAALYSVVAQRLNIPIFGVNLPQHFVLGYKDDTLLPNPGSFKGNVWMDAAMPGEVLFYINPFNRGATFSRWNIEQFLKQLNLPPHHLYFEPCSNVDIVMRMIRNLVHSYEKLGQESRLPVLRDMLGWLQPYGSMV